MVSLHPVIDSVYWKRLDQGHFHKLINLTKKKLTLPSDHSLHVMTLYLTERQHRGTRLSDYLEFLGCSWGIVTISNTTTPAVTLSETAIFSILY